MTIELSAEEKITIVEQHIKNVAYSQYNIQVSFSTFFCPVGQVVTWSRSSTL